MAPPQPKAAKKASLPPQRLQLVETAFRKLDPSNSGFASLESMKATFDAARHPRAVDGTMSQSMVREAFFNQFEPLAAARGGSVSWDEFLTYYTRLSAEIDTGRELNHDHFFEMVVSKVWRLDDDAKDPLPVTKVIPITLERPTGLLATQNMDLMWPDGAGGLIGFRAVVKPWFARSDLPEGLRGHLLFAQETQRHTHKYLPVQAALTPPHDIIWEIEPESGVYAGLQGVVLSNVDLAQLPTDLLQYILPSKVSGQKSVHFLSLPKVENPHYKRSSEVYGFRAQEHCQELLELKKAVFSGDAKGGVFAGRTGKFSNEFGGGMYRNSGLNVTTNPHKKMFTS
jgi:hypothetical protein